MRVTQFTSRQLHWLAIPVFVLACGMAFSQDTNSRDYRLVYTGGRYLAMSLSLQHLKHLYCPSLEVGQSAFDPALARLVQAARPADRDMIRKIYQDQRAQADETTRNGITLGFAESIKRTQSKQESCAEFFFFFSRQQLDALNEFRRISGP